ncbi:MAG: DNA-deoxyinosine glycosylase [Lachnospiraceae bacterium]|nr:DNA-deoxyinosine glycosylase [Lachnospiraceae bacterium]
MNCERIIHPIPPFYDRDSRILVLGSFPSIKTRESGFFYGHPQNRFWKLMTALFGEEKVPVTKEEKQAFAARHHIALWDSIHACDIVGSSDSSIRNVEPNDIRVILDAADIRMIITNGKKSHEIYRKYCMEFTGREDICLPSTSPANAAWTMEKLIQAWSMILEADK